MAEGGKLLYIAVVDDEDEKGEKADKTPAAASFRYTRSVLQSTLQLMGCKARHAFKISRRVFELIRTKSPASAQLKEGTEIAGSNTLNGNFEKDDSWNVGGSLFKEEEVSETGDRSQRIPFELYKRNTTVVARRESFIDVVCDALAEYKYVGHNQRADLVLACRIRERKESVTVLLCGTSGCGKSTLSALLGSRLGITTVISTDSIRHMMRSFVDEKQNPLLWASTYHAGEFLDPVAVAEAKAKKKARKLAGAALSVPKDEASDSSASAAGKSDIHPEVGSCAAELISPKQMAIEGFKAQSEMVIDSLDRLITAWEERKESVIVEGVHLSLNFVMGLMKKHPSIIPFMIYIANEDKHMERFAVRAKYMTLDPAKNKYVKYIRNIRTIQDYLCERADKHLVPKINNTNVDKSVAAIHATVFSCLRGCEGEQLYDPTTNTVTVIAEEYRSQCAAHSLSSKGMFQLIQRKGSSRHLMALLNTDGSVAKAWPVASVDSSGKPTLVPETEGGMGNPIYGPLKIGKAEPVNLQFGHFGISAWLSDGCTSHAGSVDESRAETDNGSKNQSSCCSSPRTVDGHAKELKEEHSVDGSDEEVDNPLEADSEEDISVNTDEQILEEMGSVDEDSKSDEEYDDLAMQDMPGSGYLTDAEEEFKDKVVPVTEIQLSDVRGEKYNQNLGPFRRTRSGQLPETSCPYSPARKEKNDKKYQQFGNHKVRKRSLSISVLCKHRAENMAPVLSGRPQR